MNANLTTITSMYDIFMVYTTFTIKINKTPSVPIPSASGLNRVPKHGIWSTREMYVFLIQIKHHLTQTHALIEYSFNLKNRFLKSVEISLWIWGKKVWTKHVETFPLN